VKDWRVDNAETLRGLMLELQPWAPWSERWDHDHCSACMAKFGTAADSLKEGYATMADFPKGARYEWICAQCFGDLKDEMGWTAAPLS
jgi:hypothetical protein